MKPCGKKNPLIQKLSGGPCTSHCLANGEAVQQIPVPRAERLEARIGCRGPQRGHLPIHDGAEHLVQLAAHDDEPFDGPLKIGQGRLHEVEQAVEAQHLLAQEDS